MSGQVTWDKYKALIIKTIMDLQVQGTLYGAYQKNMPYIRTNLLKLITMYNEINDKKETGLDNIQIKE